MLTAIEARGRTLENSLSKNKIRLRDPATGTYLHLSGKGTTRSSAYAWLGHRYQAAALRDAALARGEPWPFHAVHRALLDTPNAPPEFDA